MSTCRNHDSAFKARVALEALKGKRTVSGLATAQKFYLTMIQQLKKKAPMKVGNYNRLSIGIYGTKSGLEWVGKDNDNLFYKPFGEPTRIITRGGPGALEVANKATRMPPRHPEGYIEGFANQYSNAAELIWAGKDGRDPDPFATDLPTVKDGVRGLSFIEACVQSSTQRGVWAKASVEV